jgi:hypothetical protein
VKILVILGAAILGLIIAGRLFRRWIWKSACRAGAVRIHREMTALFQGDHDIQLTSRSEFPGHDWAGYDRVRDDLTDRGFRFLGAVEDHTISKVYPHNRTMMEAYTDGEGTTIASTYLLRDRQMTDLATEAEDGRLWLTTNADLDKLTPPPAIDRHVVPADAPVETMLAAHRERLSALRRASPSIRFVRTRTVEDAIEAARRHMRLIMTYRKSVGLLTEKEIVAMANGPDQVATARAVWRIFRGLVEEDQARAA